MFRGWFIALGAALLAFASAQSTGTFSGTVPAACVLKSPPVPTTSSTFSNVPDADGFVVKLDATTASKRLRYTLRCNGARVKVSFSHPQLMSGSPAPAPGSFYYTIVSLIGPSTSSNAKTLQTFYSGPPPTTLEVAPNGFTGLRTLSVGFSLQNGGSANIPFRPGDYKFLFTATIVAGL